MTIRVRDFETRDHVVLVWTSDERGDELPNPNGVRVEHVTRAEVGAIEIVVRGRPEPVQIAQGEEFTIPAGTPYLVRALQASTEVRCFYPKADSRTTEELRVVRQSGEADNGERVIRRSRTDGGAGGGRLDDSGGRVR